MQRYAGKSPRGDKASDVDRRRNILGRFLCRVMAEIDISRRILECKVEESNGKNLTGWDGMVRRRAKVRDVLA